MSEQPFIENARALIPMRAFFEALDVVVFWDPQTRTAFGIRGCITVRIAIGSTSPTINGISKTIYVPARIINGRTYIPLRFVG